MNAVKKITWLVLLLILIFPAVQKKFHPVKSKSLNGVSQPVSRPVLNNSTWFSGIYQDQYRRNIEDSAGFKNNFVRLYNQIDFSLFSIPHAEKIVIGKDDYLYGTEYIISWLGENFAGKNMIEGKIKDIKRLQDRLWREKKILLLVIFTPDKGTFFPGYIPHRFLSKKKEWSNYQYYAQLLPEAGVNFIDFNRYWLLMKDTSRYPLYPKTGIHWSQYGAILAADSVARYLEKKLGTSMPHIVIDSIDVSKEARFEDDDIDRTLNLIWEIPHPAYAYPVYHYQRDTSAEKPSALFIGDSFYWNWYNPGIIENLFSNKEFWYYDKDVYPETFSKPMSTAGIGLVEAMNRQKVIILLQTNAAYGDPGYGFVERALSVLDTAGNRLLNFEFRIRNSPEWLELVRKKANDQKVTIDEMIRRDAIYMINEELKKKR